MIDLDCAMCNGTGEFKNADDIHPVFSACMFCANHSTSIYRNLDNKFSENGRSARKKLVDKIAEDFERKMKEKENGNK